MIVKEKIKFFMKIIVLKIMIVQVYTKYMIKIVKRVLNVKNIST